MSYVWGAIVAGTTAAVAIAARLIKAHKITSPQSSQDSVLAVVSRVVGELLAVVVIYPTIGFLARHLPGVASLVRQVQARLLRRLDIHGPDDPNTSGTPVRATGPKQKVDRSGSDPSEPA